MVVAFHRDRASSQRPGTVPRVPEKAGHLARSRALARELTCWSIVTEPKRAFEGDSRASVKRSFGSRMLSHKPVTSLVVALALIVGIAGCQAAPHGPIGGKVTVVGSWSGAEEQAFLAMVNPFERDSGITVEYKGTRDLNGFLWESVAKGEPPDVAGLPGPGQMAEFARFGALQDLTNVIDVSA